MDSHFELTVVAAKRAKQLLGGQGASIDTSQRRDKPTVVALREIAQGKVRVKA
jgi:DNA-directed RNA polymerase subunit omega